VKRLGNVAVTVAVVTAVLLFLGSWTVGPPLSLLGPIHYLNLVPGLAGFVLLVVEWRTDGAHRFFGIGLALCAATLTMGLVVSTNGLRMLFELLGNDAVCADAVQYRQMMARGIAEAMGIVFRYAATAVLQLLLWAVLKRRLG